MEPTGLRISHQLVGAASVAAGYLVAGLLPSARPFGWVPLLLGGVLGALVQAHVGLVERFRAFEIADGPRPSWLLRPLLYGFVLCETGAAFLLGRAAFWAWLVTLAWSWLCYRAFFARGRPRLARAGRWVALALLVLVGLAARAS
ncbi:MAG: hypothetical protein JXB39_00155 [Deltaproteobacteria bacterium]|nr:hypothetical protein [Deltaproteobacteria bacterium]